MAQPRRQWKHKANGSGNARQTAASHRRAADLLGPLPAGLAGLVPGLHVAALRHPGLKLNMPPQLFCMGWCPGFEFQGDIYRRGQNPEHAGAVVPAGKVVRRTVCRGPRRCQHTKVGLADAPIIFVLESCTFQRKVAGWKYAAWTVLQQNGPNHLGL